MISVPIIEGNKKGINTKGFCLKEYDSERMEFYRRENSVLYRYMSEELGGYRM